MMQSLPKPSGGWSGRGWAVLRAIAWSLTLALGALSAAPAVAQEEPSGGASGTSPAAIPAARQAAEVAVITIQGEIDQWTARSVERRIREAEQGGADAMVFEIDSPGGEVGAVVEISKMIKNSSIPNTVAWIHSDAYSGGAIIALACREMVVSQYATMGDALPINIGQMLFGQGMPEEERQKILSFLLAEIVDSARRNDYDEKLVQAFVALDVELWWVENTETGRRLFVDENEYYTLFGEEPPRTSPRVASGTLAGEGSGSRQSTSGPRVVDERGEDDSDFKPASPRLAERLERAGGVGESLLESISSNLETPSNRPPISGADRGDYRLIEYVTDGRTALVLKTEDLIRYGFAERTVTDDEGLKAFFGAERLVRRDMNWSEHLARFMTSLPVRGLLVVVFLLAMFIEMAAPGIGLPGGVAMLALVGLIAPPLLVGAASWWGLAALGVGFVLILLELFVMPGFGFPGVGGVILMFAGLVGIVAAPLGSYGGGASAQEMLWSTATVLMAFVTAGVGMYFVSKHYGSLPLFNKLILTDEPAEGEEQGGLLAAMAPAAAAGPVAQGDVGVARTPLRPAGTAEFGDELLDVVCEAGFVDAGAQVRVVSVSKYRVAVEPLRDADFMGETA